MGKGCFIFKKYIRGPGIILNNFIVLAFLRKIEIAETDAELLASYQSSGDNAVLGVLYSRYMELVYGVCLKYLREPEDAKDAVINIYEELCAKLRRYEIQNFKSWLHTLSKNHCLMLLRRRNVRIVNIEEHGVHYANNSHQEDEVMKERQFGLMERCMEELQDGQKTAVRLFYLENKCYKEIAMQTGNEIGKVRSDIQNGRRNLKNCMEKNAEPQK